MEQQEYTAMQVTLLVRTERGLGQGVKEFFEKVSTQYELQDTLGQLLKEQLHAADIDFKEVIISLDSPPQQAKQTRSKRSFFDRLFRAP